MNERKPPREPETNEELACWVNSWGGECEHLHESKAWLRGYDRAMMDVLERAERLNPGWLNAWRGSWRKQ